MRTADLAAKALAEGGMTIDPETNDVATLTSGYMVGIGRENNGTLYKVDTLGEAGLWLHTAYLGRLLDLIPIDADDLYVGCWVEGGVAYWELAQHFDNWGDAMLAAIAGRQISFWDLANSVAIPAYTEND